MIKMNTLEVKSDEAKIIKNYVLNLAGKAINKLTALRRTSQLHDRCSHKTNEVQARSHLEYAPVFDGLPPHPISDS